jgi:hypothetical protein
MYSRACGMGWLVTQRSKALSPPAPCVLLRGWAADLAAAAFLSEVVLSHRL